MAETGKLVFTVTHGPEDLIEGAEVVAAGRFVAEITSATNSLVY